MNDNPNMSAKTGQKIEQY